MSLYCKDITNPLSVCTVAVGTFDGVHIGHARVVSAAAHRAKELGVTARVLTFPDLPGDNIETRAKVPRIMSNSQRQRALVECGAEEICYFDLKDGGCEYSPERFVEEVLCGKLNAKEVFCGFNFRFGKGGNGDTALLEKLLSEKGVALTVISPVTYDGTPVSSSRIRGMIANGDVDAASKLLGRVQYASYCWNCSCSPSYSITMETINYEFHRKSAKLQNKLL